MANPVVHFEILGKDGKKSQAFYASLFGWNIDASNPMDYGMISAQDGHGIGGGVAAAQQGGQPMVTVYVEVADLAAALKKAESLGGKMVMPPMDVPDRQVKEFSPKIAGAASELSTDGKRINGFRGIVGRGVIVPNPTGS